MIAMGLQRTANGAHQTGKGRSVMTPFDELTVHPIRMARLLKVFGACLSVFATVAAFQVFGQAAREPLDPADLPRIGAVALSPLIVCLLSIGSAYLLRRGRWRFTACFAASLQVFWALGVYVWVLSSH
jgi:O-antigen/teichoic acid export membrane protein